MEEPGHEDYTVFKEYKNCTAYEKMRAFIMFVYERFGECDPYSVASDEDNIPDGYEIYCGLQEPFHGSLGEFYR